MYPNIQKRFSKYRAMHGNQFQNKETKETSENLRGHQIFGKSKASYKCYVPRIPVFRILQQQKSLSFLQKLVETTPGGLYCT